MASPLLLLCCLFLLLWATCLSCGAEEEIRSFLLEQDQRHTQQQICMGGWLVQGKSKFLLHTADTVEHGVPVGKKGIAGLFQ